MNQFFCFYCMSPVGEDGTCPNCGLTAGAYHPAPHHIPPGTILMNRYLLGRVLGEGGFGITYIACDLRLDLKVAIKEFFPTDKASRHAAASLDVTSYTSAVAGSYESAKRKFLSEARTMAKMEKQPEVVGVRDFFETNNTAYIVMEFVDGTTFRDLVKQEGGKIPAQKLLDTIKPLFDALHTLHASGLVHRDISPDNLMLERGKVRLLDFGCARESSHGTNTLTIALKHGYAPIEQYTNHGQGPWTDIYALAATIYFCVTGKSPVRSTDRLLGDELTLPSKLGVELTHQQEKALVKAMSIQPRRRFQTMEEFYAALYVPTPVPAPDPVPIPAAEPAVKPADQSRTSEPVKTRTKTAQTTRPLPKQEPKPVIGAEADRKPKKESVKPAGKKKNRKPLLIGAGILALVLLVILGIGNKREQVPEKTAAVSARAHIIRGQCGGFLTWELTEETGRLEILGDGAMYHYDDPSSGSDNIAPWYEHRDKIRSVFVGDLVRNIGNWAFAGCSNLTEAELGKGVREIGVSAFDRCGLEKIRWEEGLEEIRENAFSGTKLTEVTFPESLRYVGNYAFEHCPNLKQAMVTSEKTRFAFDTADRPIFSDENTEVPLGFNIFAVTNSVVHEYAEIMGYTFYGTRQGGWETVGKCGKDLMWYLDLDSGMLKITGTGDMDDYNGSWMQGTTPYAGRTMAPWENYREQIYSVSIGDGVASIGENAFENCVNLQDVHWGNTVKTVSSYAFQATALDQVILPESVSSMEPFAFNECRRLKEVILPESLPKLRTCVFACCSNLKKAVIGSRTVIEYSTENGTPFNHQKANYEQDRWIPVNLTIYGQKGSPAEEFASVYRCSFVMGIGTMTADYEGQCGNHVWWFIDEDQRTLVLYGTYKPWVYNTSLDESQWPESEANAYRAWKNGGELFATPPEFYYHRGKFDKLIIQPGIIWVSDNLFKDTYIREADLGTVEEIGLGAFDGTKLTEVTVPASVKRIRGMSFADCEELTEVTILGSAKMELSIFRNTPKLRKVTFSQGVTIQDDPGMGDLFNQNDLPEQIPVSEQLVFYVRDHSDALRYAKEHGIVYRTYN